MVHETQIEIDPDLVELRDTEVTPPRLSRRERLPAWFWKGVVVALVIRVALMWFTHPWDITTFYNMFVNLSDGVSPYSEFERLTRVFSTSVNHWVQHYEYYAYPPGLIYLYYLPAQAWAAITGPHELHWLLPGSGYVIPPREVLEPLFQVFFKAPIFAADVAIGVLLARMARPAVGLAYLLNPLVVLVSAAFTFEALAVVCAVASYYLLTRDRPLFAGVAMGIGFVIKIFPAVLLPAAVIWALRRGRTKSMWRIVGGFVGSAAVLVLPIWDGFLSTLGFHSARTGGGMTVHQLIYLHDMLSLEPSLWLQVGLSPAVGTITLVAALAAAYLYLWRSNPPLLSGFVIVLSAFLLGSKLVNEQFAIWLIPFLLLSAANRPSTRTTRLVMWSTVIPMCFVALHVPLNGFLYPLHRWGLVGLDQLAAISESVIGTPGHAIALSALALGFVILLIAVIRAHSPDSRNGVLNEA